MALVPKDVHKMVQDGHGYAQANLESLKDRRRFHKGDVDELDKEIADLSRRLEETSDWLRNNTAKE